MVSHKSLIVDGTGMCGACRVQIGGQTKFTCVDGPEFDGALINFDECMHRQAMYDHIEGRKLLEEEEIRENHQCHIGGIAHEALPPKSRVPVREQAPEVRRSNFREVCFGYNAEEAVEEARRCLTCKRPLCMEGCPVHIRIPDFISKIKDGQFDQAAILLKEDTALPSVCGRVCPQESQCEGKCVLGRKGDPVAIGKLERFIGDWSMKNRVTTYKPVEKKGKKVAVVGSGPAGLTCAKELRCMGYDVTVYEALHEFGGVLVYGIPEFRLPKNDIVKPEIATIKNLGVRFESDVVIGRTLAVDDLMTKWGYDAVFLATGAGFPNFMNIEGENLCGVVSANEFLTRPL